MKFYNQSIEDTLKELKTNASYGLSSKEVLKRQKQYGFNILESKQNKSLFSRFLAQFKDFMIIILILAAIVSFLVSLLEGHADYVDPIIIFAIILLNAALGVFQEAKAEKSLEALKKMSSPHALVVRDNAQLTIPSKELVPGDVIILETGHFIPADARLLTAVNLKVDEASLTGESHPAEKNADFIAKENTLLGDRLNFAPATGIVTYGRGTAVVTATGMDTEVGHIAKMIMTDDTPDTPLQKRLEKTGKALGIAALIICFVIFGIGVFNKKPIFDMFMTSVSLAVAAIPEGLPAIVTIMLSLGVQRMAKKNAVIRHLPAVETLGSATVICSDKTGTLTQNKMTVTSLASIEGPEISDSKFASTVLMLSAQCNDASVKQEDIGSKGLPLIKHLSSKNKSDKLPLHSSTKWTVLGEPTEAALLCAATNIGIQKAKLDLLEPRVYEIPFDSSRKLMTTVHKASGNNKGTFLSENTTYYSITKGAPDVLISRCTSYYYNGKVLPITTSKRSDILKYNQDMAKDALRVIAVAYREHAKTPQKSDASLENHLIFVGLIGMIDPPRPEVIHAVHTCKRSGIKPVMITGDHVLTACAIGKNLGILTSEKEAITGYELNQLTDYELQSKVHHYSVYARVSPEHKVRVVKALQANGHVVAMTGDGINDAPALKAADIGCAMGKSGTDVAKNAADMILTDDNFTTIVEAVKEGRGIYDNIKKSVHFLLSSNIGEIITIFIAILFGLSSPLLAVQLLWVNLVTDSLPAIALGVEPPEKDIMKRPPISPKKGMFADGLIFQIIFEGMMIGLLSLIAYIIGCKLLPDASIILGRTMCFSVLSLSQLFHSFNMRSKYSLLQIGFFGNIKLCLSFIICSILLVSVISIDVLASIFKVISLSPMQWGIVVLLSFFPIVLVELQKAARKN